LLQRVTLGMKQLERGLADFVTGSDLHGDQLAAPHPAVRSLVMDSEPAGSSFEIHTDLVR
jgi:hypothetical protein